MTIKGELKDIHLADIFQMVGLQRQEGTLIVGDGETKKWLYFSQDGISLLSSGKRRPVPLGQMLLQSGRITQKQLEEALAVWRRTGKRIGEVLCEFGLTTQEEIEALVREQISEEICDLLDWQGTTFEFTPGPPPEEFSQAPGDRRNLKFDVNTILLEAARRADEWKKLESEIGSVNEIFVRVRPKGASVHLEGDALAVYPMIDGARTVHDIITALQMPRADVGSTILALREAGFIRPATREEVLRLTKQTGIEEHKERLARLLELAIMREDDVELRKQLAGVYEDLGLHARAVAHYRHIAHVLTEQYKLAEASEALREATRLRPDDAETREQLVELYVRLANVPHAVLHLKRLAQQHMDNNANAKALAAYRRALELSPQDFDCRKQVVDLLLKIKDVDGALDECIGLEQSATTRAERQEVRDHYASLLALAPNLLEAKSRLAGLTDIERREARSRRISLHVAIVGALVFIAVGFIVTRLYLTQKHRQAKLVRIEQLRKEGKYDEAQDELARDNSEWAAGQKEALRARQQKEAETRQRRFEHKEREARWHEQAGRLNTAANMYRELADDAEKQKPWKAREFRDRASKLEEQWQYASDEKQVGEEMIEAARYKEAHEHFSRMAARSSDLCKALGIKLPIYVSSIPSGASLSVDDLPAGETPRVVYKQPGSPVRLVLEKSGHHPQVESILDDSVWQVEIPLPRIRRWLFQTGGAVEAQPVCYGASVLVGSRDGVLYALDSATGSEKWRFTASDDIMTTPVIGNGCVFFGTNDGNFYAVDLETHEQKWVARVWGFIRSAPAVVREGNQWIVLFGASDAGLYSRDADTGKELWTHHASQAVETTPCVAGGTVFIGDDGGQLYSLDLRTGRLLWRYDADGPIYTSPLTGDGVVFIGSERGTVYAIDAEKGTTIWTYGCGGGILTSAAMAGSTLFVGCGDHRLYALDTKTGQPTWQFSAAAPVTSPPVVDGDTLYFGAEDGSFYALAVPDGSLKWKTSMDNAVRAPAGISEDAVFVGADDHRVCAFKR